MTANLEGIRFDQIYGDNSGTHDGQQPFDTDGDGTATQEDEFVSITNTTAVPMDISGWQIWSDSTGSGAPDTPQDGLYHTFPPGSVLQPGETLFIINEITGDVPDWAQEASEGGVESGEGGESTNLLTEGNSGEEAEAVALVNPVTGEYIVFNMSPTPPVIQSLPGFPGTTNVGTVDGHAVAADQLAGTAYRFNTSTGGYEAQSAQVTCFAEGTLIATPSGDVPIECLAKGDLVLTKDNGAQAILWIASRHLTRAELETTGQHPIEFKPGSLGPGRPGRSLQVSPQHRFLLPGDVLAPARGLIPLPKVRAMRGCRGVTYHHILLAQHEVIFAEGAETESLLPGPTFLARCGIADRLAIMRISGPDFRPARRCLRVSEARKLAREMGALASA